MGGEGGGGDDRTRYKINWQEREREIEREMGGPHLSLSLFFLHPPIKTWNQWNRYCIASQSVPSVKKRPTTVKK